MTPAVLLAVVVAVWLGAVLFGLALARAAKVGDRQLGHEPRTERD